MRPGKHELLSASLSFVFMSSSLSLILAGTQEMRNFDGYGFQWHRLEPVGKTSDRQPDKLSVWFKTKQPSGLLVVNYREDGSVLAVAVKEGKLR